MCSSCSLTEDAFTPYEIHRIISIVNLVLQIVCVRLLAAVLNVIQMLVVQLSCSNSNHSNCSPCGRELSLILIGFSNFKVNFKDSVRVRL